jgi:hypothetical protein
MSLQKNNLNSSEQIPKHQMTHQCHSKKTRRKRPMQKEKLVSLMISLPKEIRDRLRKMAAQRNLNDPNEVTSAAQIGREIICAHFAENPASKQDIGAIEDDALPF